ncbi:Hsp20/alpha crystallin family protein [Eudoraea chungangensis]|uniref:Hsp20/alpha crystallin family protein n=1 Tax=Eudoraea chungangensis TaxID=1481905 RepID=UPI0023EC8509|nr:Hsp20/alpha crystallin family protein [Eudoraea chungangensis]
MSIIRKNNVVFPSLMNDIFKPDWFGGLENHTSYVPAVNIMENETDFQLELFVPGRKREDFNVEIDEQVLTISSELSQENKTENNNYSRKEYSYESFKRAFTLPESVDEDAIKASYKDGVLKFVLPKKEEALPKPKRLIEIGQ